MPRAAYKFMPSPLGPDHQERCARPRERGPRATAPPIDLGVNRFSLLAGLNLDLLRLAGFRDRHLNFKDAVSKPAAYMIQVQAGRKRKGSIELAVGELREGVLIETFRSFPLSLDDQLIVLHAHANVILPNARKNRPQVQILIVPTR